MRAIRLSGGNTRHRDALWEEVSVMLWTLETLGAAGHVDVTLTRSIGLQRTKVRVPRPPSWKRCWPPDLNLIRRLWDVLDRQGRTTEAPPLNFSPPAQPEAAV